MGRRGGGGGRERTIARSLSEIIIFHERVSASHLNTIAVCINVPLESVKLFCTY